MKIMFSSSEQLKNIYDEMSTLSTKQLNLNNSLSRHPSILNHSRSRSRLVIIFVFSIRNRINLMKSNHVKYRKGKNSIQKHYFSVSIIIWSANHQAVILFETLYRSRK